MSDQAPSEERLAAWQRSERQREDQAANLYDAIEEEDAGTYTFEPCEDENGNQMIRISEVPGKTKEDGK